MVLQEETASNKNPCTIHHSSFSEPNSSPVKSVKNYGQAAVDLHQVWKRPLFLEIKIN